MNTPAPDASILKHDQFDPVITAPERQTPGQRRIGQILTLGFWMFWIYLWLPLVSLLAWLFGFELFYERMLMQKGYERLLGIAPLAGLLVLALCGGLLLWATYNYMRFRHKQRRSKVTPVQTQEVASHFGMDEKLLDANQSSRLVLARHDDHGTPLSMTPLDRKPT